ncbi:MAG: TIGR04283 family arsenosugar biosynthesis glycosyltransferase [Vicingaceae bacterium]
MISIVIPTLNEEVELPKTIKSIARLAQDPESLEIIIADGGSVDDTVDIAKSMNLKTIACGRAQRAFQLNCGAEEAINPILYFLHADSLPPAGFDRKIAQMVQKGAFSGCFTMKFNRNHPFLRFYGWFTRFSPNIFRGGDQSLFVKRSVFLQLGGFKEGMDLMEDYEMISRLRKKGNFKIVKGPVITSSRRYDINGELRLQWIYFCLQMMYRTGYSQLKMRAYYQKNIRT